MVGLVHVADGRLLMVRSKRQAAFYLPGGKIDPGETEVAALHREAHEELGVRLEAASVRFVGRYVADAYGEGAGTQVDLACYSAAFAGTPEPAAEIAELAWMNRDEYVGMAETAPAVVALLHDLRAEGAA